MPSLPCRTTEALRTISDQYVCKQDGPVGLVHCIVDRDGNELFHHASGLRQCSAQDSMDSDSIFWLASCTKLVTAIAAMQLVERGLVALDDGNQLETMLPELRDIQVLQETDRGQLHLTHKDRQITLRMLLAHTAGFGYSFANAKLKRFSEPIGVLEVASEEDDIFSQPLVNQPGTQWEYGVSMDWVGRLIERVSGQSLEEYFQQNIFIPLGLKDISFLPNADMKRRLVALHARRHDGSLHVNESGHLCRKPLRAKSLADMFCAGGHGLFATPRDYCQILATILHQGMHKPTGHQLLAPETVQVMLENQIPNQPDFARDTNPPAKRTLINHQIDTYAQARDVAQGWGLSFFLLLGGTKTGRKPGSIFWTGLPNLIWWADIEAGIAGMTASQIIPFYDRDVFTCHDELETLVYRDLKYTDSAAGEISVG